MKSPSLQRTREPGPNVLKSSGCKIAQLHALRHAQKFERHLLEELQLRLIRESSVNRGPIRVGVTENILWCSLGINVDQASVAQQEFGHRSPLAAQANRMAPRLATRCVELQNRRLCPLLLVFGGDQAQAQERTMSAQKIIRKRAKKAINLESARNLMARRQLAGA